MAGVGINGGSVFVSTMQEPGTILLVNLCLCTSSIMWCKAPNCPSEHPISCWESVRTVFVLVSRVSVHTVRGSVAPQQDLDIGGGGMVATNLRFLGVASSLDPSQGFWSRASLSVHRPLLWFWPPHSAVTVAEANINFLVALHMINWTIGQLGLWKVWVLGTSPQGSNKDKDKGRLCQSRSVSLLLCLHWVKICPLTLREKCFLLLNYIRWIPVPTSVSHTFFKLMYVCVKFFRCYPIRFLQVEKVSASRDNDSQMMVALRTR